MSDGNDWIEEERLRAGIPAFDLEEEIDRLRAENKALRTDLDVACSVFSKRTWTGRLDMPFAFHVARGRKMAMLKAEENP